MKVEILRVADNKFVDALIIPIQLRDIDVITDSGRFPKINWLNLLSDYKSKKMKLSNIYKLVKDDVILGVTYFFHEKIFDRLEINKLEVSIENVGRNKEYRNVAGSLIAFACKNSMRKLSGEVFIMYSAEAKHIYIDNYGMQPYDEFYVISDRANSTFLINAYLNFKRNRNRKNKSIE